MDEYQSPYFALFHALEDAIDQIEALNFGQAKEILLQAQKQAEEEYINQNAPSA